MKKKKQIKKEPELRLCDDCSGEFPDADFDKCGCGYESCRACHEIHAETCAEEENDDAE